MLDHLMHQIVLRRDGTVAKVTGISDGWLLLNGSVDDSALPDETLLIDFGLGDDVIRKLAYEFGVDTLQAERVPDLARKRLAQDNYAYQVLQKIDHPYLDDAYLTILGINEAERYKVRVKPEKGSSYEMLLSEQSIRAFETEGVLPVKSEMQTNFSVGDVVRLGKGDKVLIIEGKTATEWQVRDPITDDIDQVSIDETLFPTSNTVAEVILSLRADRQNEIAKQGNLIKSNESLRAENNVLHKQLDQAKADDRDVEREKLQGQLELEKKAHAATNELLKVAREDAAQSHIALRQMQKQGNGNAAARAGYEAKIVKNTGEADFEKLWNEGWTCEHMQFTHDGKVMTVWQRYSAPAPTPEHDRHVVSVDPDEINEEILDINAVADEGYAPNPIGMGKMPMTISPPANQVQLGKYGMALVNHGLEKTREAMNAEVTLAGLKAMQDSNPFGKRPIQHFLPSAEVTS